MKKPWWDRLFNRFKEFISPVTVTAAALTAAVVWVYLPVLQADAAEMRKALVNPSTESAPWLQTLAAVAHQLFFVEGLVICEILFIGTIFILLTRFVFYIVRLVVIEYRRTRRTLRSRSQPRVRVTENGPKTVPQSDERAKAQGQQLEGPLVKKMYLIPGPTQIHDPRKPADVKDGSSQDGQAK